MKKLYLLLSNNFSLYFLIKIFGTAFSLYVFALFTPLIDMQMYLNFSPCEGASPCIENAALRTRIVHEIASSLNYISSPFFTNLLFSLFSGMGILILSYLLKNKLILLMLLAPSTFIWTSIAGKEAIFYGANALLLLFWTIYIKDSHKKLTIFTCLGILSLLILCLIFRPHYSVPLLYLFASSYILLSYKLKKFKTFLVFLMITIISLAIIYFYMGAKLPYNLIIHGYESISPSGFASRHEIFNIDLSQPYLEFDKSLIFKYSFFSIIGPFPNELVRIEFIPFFLEGIIIFFVPILTFIYYRRKRINDKYFLLFKLSLLPAIFMAFIIHAPFGILNPGSAIRWRVNFELLFYAYPLILLLLSIKKQMDTSQKPNKSY